MRIAVAADHAAFDFKQDLLEELQHLGHEVEDFGTESSASCDYPDFGIRAAHAVAAGQCDRAILSCSNGIGMSMLANKIPGIRAALVYSERTAVMTREHHDSNVLCLGAQQFSTPELLAFVRLWLATSFAGGRHARRIGKVSGLDPS